ncbi:RTA1 like protein-domain-containing protein [Lophiotrema nucula]|uniref:RTA1 like protein-domain-containing protein n=1 Tax=Lophiotrema nucula TaxID=690887 RepID=A0A6A5YXF0_9PLEO|nr:RTA1 like protein-domain-containing protein [Lophiotrema nucula]
MSTDDCKHVSVDCPVEDTIYGYAPNLGANAFYAVIFALCSVVQLYFIFRYWRIWKGYSILVFVGALGECCGYVGRILLHQNPWNGAAMTIQLLLIMVAPSFLAAALYMTLRTLVQYFGPENTKLPARLWTWPFVTADLIGFISQCGGGIMSSMTDTNPSLGKAGNTIMVAGVSFQAAVMFLAGILATDFAIRLYRKQGVNAYRDLPKDLKIFLLSMMAAFLMILARCIYRIPEMAGGVGGPMMRKEAEFMIFDGCLILLSVTLLCLAHPGIYASATQNGTARTYKSMAPSSDLEHGYELERDSSFRS